jgi:hypothetical protein
MTPSYYLSVILLVFFRAQGEQTCTGSSSINVTNTCHSGYDNDDNALQGSACSNERIVPGGTEEPEVIDHDNLEDEDAYGVLQVRDPQYQEEIKQAILDMRVYFQNLRSNPNTASSMHTLLDNCKNEHEHCAFWKVIGECEKVSW